MFFDRNCKSYAFQYEQNWSYVPTQLASEGQIPSIGGRMIQSQAWEKLLIFVLPFPISEAVVLKLLPQAESLK